MHFDRRGDIIPLWDPSGLNKMPINKKESPFAQGFRNAVARDLSRVFRRHIAK